MATWGLTGRLILSAVLAAGVVLAADGPVLAVCGDGVLDPGEQCDHGVANGTDDCCSTTCQLVDLDGDGTCDAIDPCDDNNDFRVKDATLSLRGLSRPPGDDSLRFSGTLTIPNTPPIDPSVSGLRLRAFAPWFDPHGSAVADMTIPGGPKWHPRVGGAAWRYRDPTGGKNGIQRIELKLLPPLVPTTHLTKVAFSIEGRRTSFPLTPAMVTSDPSPPFDGSTLQVTMSVGPGSALNAQCGSVFYTTVQPTHCEFSSSGDRVTCSGPPPVGPCHVGDPNDLMVCDVVDAVHAEDTYFTANGTYYTGSCTGLPGFVPSPGVTCYVTGSTTAFTVSTTDPDAIYFRCEWSSNVPPGVPNILCY